MTISIDLQAVRSRPDFTAEERDGFVLVKPIKIKHVWAEDEIRWRSVLTRPCGEIVSVGFPKFFNYGENEADRIVVDTLMSTGDVLFTEKLDGSLVVRSVIDGAVHLRTRGNYSLGDFAHIREFIAATYPDVLDPTRGSPAASYLFEYTAPDNQIVLSYAKRELTFLGRMCHAQLAFYADPCPFSTPTVERVPLRAESAPEAQSLIHSRERTEGVVAWLRRPDGSIHLSKFKSAWYLRAHALRSFATPERIRDYAWANGFETGAAFVAGLMRDGVDYESAVAKAPIFEAFIAERSRRLGELDAAQAKAASIRALPDRGAKARAIQADPELEPYFHQLIYFVLPDEAKAADAREAFGLGLTRMEHQNLKATKADAARVVLDVDAAMRDDG